MDRCLVTTLFVPQFPGLAPDPPPPPPPPVFVISQVPLLPLLCFTVQGQLGRTFFFFFFVFLFVNVFSAGEICFFFSWGENTNSLVCVFAGTLACPPLFLARLRL